MLAIYDPRHGWLFSSGKWFATSQHDGEPYQSESNILMVLEMSTKHDHISLSPILGPPARGTVRDFKGWEPGGAWCYSFHLLNGMSQTPGNIFIVPDDYRRAGSKTIVHHTLSPPCSYIAGTGQLFRKLKTKTFIPHL